MNNRLRMAFSPVWRELSGSYNMQPFIRKIINNIERKDLSYCKRSVMIKPQTNKPTTNERSESYAG